MKTETPPAWAKSVHQRTLGAAIRQVHEHCVAQAGKAVNISLTLRNWVIGYYIREYEQDGADTAQYGQDLLSRLSRRRGEEGSVGYHPRELRRCREFYIAYPQIRGTLSPGFDDLLPRKIRDSLPPESEGQRPARIRGAPSPGLQVPPERLVTSLSFSHEHMGQLNTYVSSYKRDMMTAGDNPPIGILLCTRKDQALVEYALADMDNRLFVSKYQLELPSREVIQRFIEAQLKGVGDA